MGGLADRFGHRRVFLAGVAGFTAASLLCAVAPSLEMLIVFRVLQGVGAAAIAPTSLAIVLDSFPAEKRATGVGLWGAAAAAAAAIGPTLGGALVELSDWRLVFFVNLPLGLAVVLGRPSPAGAAAEGHRQPPARSAGVRWRWPPGWRRSRWGSSRATTGAGPRPAVLGCFASGALLLGVVVARSLTPPAPDRRALPSSPTAPSRSATSAPCSSPPPSSR